jgi:prepilin-type N-terminal cleavage/methylation domain-containing protein
MNKILLPHRTKAFSLLELLVVATIVAIIAGFSVPSYMTYVKKTRVNALWEQTEAAKLVVESKYLKQNTAVNTITVNSGAAEYTTSSDPYVKCVTIQSGTVSVVGDPASFSSEDIWISWVPTTTTGSLVWTCLYSEDSAPYLSSLATSCSQGSSTDQFTDDTACN